jgi:hypothetical protein
LLVRHPSRHVSWKEACATASKNFPPKAAILRGSFSPCVTSSCRVEHICICRAGCLFRSGGLFSLVHYSFNLLIIMPNKQPLHHGVRGDSHVVVTNLSRTYMRSTTFSQSIAPEIPHGKSEITMVLLAPLPYVHFFSPRG